MDHQPGEEGVEKAMAAEEAPGEVPTQTRRDRQKEETRRRVYEASLEIFRKDGVAACRIDDIATLAGVSRGTFYFHFPTKEDVLVEMLRVFGEAVAENVDACPREAGLADVLVVLAESLSEQWASDARLLPDLATVALKQTAERLADQDSNPLRSALALRFRLAVERGELASFLAPQMLSDLYLANVLVAMLAWCGYPELSLTSVLEGVTALFLGGAASLPAADA